MKKKFIFIIFIFVVFANVFSTDINNVVPEYLKTKIFTYPETINTNYPFYIGVQVTLTKNYHINTNNPKFEYLVPTELKIENENIKHIEYIYPEPDKLMVEFLEEPIYVFENTFFIISKITLDPDYNKNDIEFSLNFAYQACDEINCFPPQKTNETIKYSVSETKTNNSQIPAWLKKHIESPTPIKKTDKDKKNIFWFLILSFLGGLLLNVMPCVLPIISIKIFGLVKLAGENRKTFINNNLLFSAGILTIFILIAILIIMLKHAGAIIGWGFQFQSPVFLVFITSVVFVFGLSLFGVFTIILPLPSKINTRMSRYQGGLSSYFEGMLVTFLATPCTAPLLGTALGFAFSQTPQIILIVFVFIALGLSFPYLLITVFPGFSKILPKPGQWMNTFKQIMGFPLMATAIWLLWILGNVTGKSVLIGTLTFLLVLGFICWFFGIFITNKTSFAKKMLIWLVSMLIITISYVYFIHSNLTETVNKKLTVKTIMGLNKIPFSNNKLKQLKDKGKPIFIEFSADWCMTCQVNKKTVLNAKEIIQVFKDNDIIYMYGDYTKKNPELTKTIQKYGKAGVPLYVFYPADNHEDYIVLPEFLTKNIILNTINH